jgi:hypothetical protein
MYTYTKEMYDKFKFKFDGLENIERNWSQCFQDLLVLAVLNGQCEGTFLEIGAHDSHFLSNTLLLESQFYWNGISIDIDVNSANSFMRNNRKAKFILNDALKINYKEILKPYGNVLDYASIDIEPNINTLNCLKLLPLDDVKFKVISYEHDVYSPETSKEYNEAIRQESRSILQSHGYVLVAGNISNLTDDAPFEDWYICEEYFVPEIINKFKRDNDNPIASHKYMLME